MPFACEWALQLSAEETVLHRGPGHICIHIARLTECGESDLTHWFFIEQKINGSKHPQHVSHAFTHFLWAVIRDQIFWDAVTGVNNWNDKMNHSRCYIFFNKVIFSLLVCISSILILLPLFFFFTQTQESTHTFFLSSWQGVSMRQVVLCHTLNHLSVVGFFISPKVHDIPVQQG